MAQSIGSYKLQHLLRVSLLAHDDRFSLRTCTWTHAVRLVNGARKHRVPPHASTACHRMQAPRTTARKHRVPPHASTACHRTQAPRATARNRQTGSAVRSTEVMVQVIHKHMQLFVGLTMGNNRKHSHQHVTQRGRSVALHAVAQRIWVLFCICMECNGKTVWSATMWSATMWCACVECNCVVPPHATGKQAARFGLRRSWSK
jgi:hypothetical protein